MLALVLPGPSCSSRSSRAGPSFTIGSARASPPASQHRPPALRRRPLLSGGACLGAHCWSTADPLHSLHFAAACSLVLCKLTCRPPSSARKQTELSLTALASSPVVVVRRTLAALGSSSYAPHGLRSCRCRLPPCGWPGSGRAGTLLQDECRYCARLTPQPPTLALRSRRREGSAAWGFTEAATSLHVVRTPSDCSRQRWEQEEERASPSGGRFLVDRHPFRDPPLRHGTVRCLITQPWLLEINEIVTLPDQRTWSYSKLYSSHTQACQRTCEECITEQP